jgi:hypothetical protein
MKVTRSALLDLLDLAGDDCPHPLRKKQLQVIIDIQGYYSGITRKFVPRLDGSGRYSGWHTELR